jgi:acyl phosphate:glycerol-3-phosphate acyltransferase
VAAGVVGYLAGTVPSADVVARLATGGELDVRRDGTANPGAANVVGLLGRRWGYAVLAADVVKAAAACRAGRRLAGDAGQHVAGTMAVVGHCYPVWSGFRGGKGVGCSVGHCLATFPAYFPIDLGVAAVVNAGPWKRHDVAATMAASTVWVGASVLWWRRGWRTGAGVPTVALPISAVVSSVIIADRFRRTRRPA